MIGTSARVGLGRSPVVYPPPSTLLFSLWRMIVVAAAAFFLHHFITTTIITPWIFHVVKSPFVQTYFIDDNFVTRFLVDKTFVGTRLALNGQTVDDALMYVLGTTLVHLCFYVPINTFFALCDHFHWLTHYRIPVEKRALPSAQLIRATLIDFAVSFVFAGPVTLLVLVLFPGKHWKGFDSVEQMNTWSEPCYTQFACFLGALVFNEAAFYLAHRAVHEIPGAYKLIHSQHHRYIGAISISAEYAHPVEAVIANFLPTSLFMAMMSSRGVPIAAWITWVYVRLVETLEAHSGYDFRTTFLYEIGLLHGSCVHHYWHHTQNRGNYGVFWTDYLGGTMDLYLIDERRQKAPAEVEAEKLLKGERLTA